MPEADREGERYSADQPQAAPGFFLKGCHQLDWGMKNRLARTFNPASGRTVMLAVDHGYFQGPTTGLERIDLSIVPLLPQCDALFCTRGILRVGMPVMGITAVGKDMVRDAKYFRLACRIIAELGAQYVKTYYVEKDFETVTASCP